MSTVTPYSIQKFRGGYAIVWPEDSQRHRRRLDATNRSSAEAEARQLWEKADSSSWTVGRIVTGYIANLAKNKPPSLQRRKDAWKAMICFWENIDPGLIDEEMCKDYRDDRLVANATARYELLMLSAALNWALDKKHIASRSKV